MKLQPIIILVGLLAMCADAIAQEASRPIPVQKQYYVKKHKWLPGVSVTEPAFRNMHGCNDPVCCECETCYPTPLGDLHRRYDADWKPSVLVPRVRQRLDLRNRIRGFMTNRLGVNGATVYGRGELVWWMVDDPSIAPLVTTSLPGTVRENAGVLGQSGTSALVNDLSDTNRLGGRYIGGLRLHTFDGCNTIEAVYTHIGDDDYFNRLDSNNSDIIARPFFNTQTGLQDSRLTNFPDVAGGFVDIDASTSMQMFQLAFRRKLGCFGGVSTDYIIGYRGANLSDTLRIFDRSTALSGGAAGSRFDVTDEFRTTNKFNGADFGAIFQWPRTRRLSVDLLVKLGLGRTHSDVRIAGRTSTFPASGDRVNSVGGLLAQPTNIGRYSNSSFSAVTELGLTMNYKFRSNVRGTLGYTFIAWSDVMRAADQIDPAINTSQVGGGTLSGVARPGYPPDQSTFIAHGLRFGVEVAF